MSGAQSSFVFGLACLIHAGVSEKTYPQAFQCTRSLEHRIGSCSAVLELGGVVANKYHVSPSFMMEGSCVPTTSPSTGTTRGSSSVPAPAEKGCRKRTVRATASKPKVTERFRFMNSDSRKPCTYAMKAFVQTIPVYLVGSMHSSGFWIPNVLCPPLNRGIGTWRYLEFRMSSGVHRLSLFLRSDSLWS